jgi:transcription elongation factor Elf1
MMAARIHFVCPTCNAKMSGPIHKAGQKIHCLNCGQRLQVPPVEHSRTILATDPDAYNDRGVPPVRQPIQHFDVVEEVREPERMASRQCHGCRRMIFDDEQAYARNVRVGKSSSWVFLQPNIPSVTTEHYQMRDFCAECHSRWLKAMCGLFGCLVVVLAIFLFGCGGLTAITKMFDKTNIIKENVK